MVIYQTSRESRILKKIIIINLGSYENSSLKKVNEVAKIKSNKTNKSNKTCVDETSEAASSSDEKWDTRPSSDV